MPREHPSIKLTPDELVAFLRTETFCILGTLDAEGGPCGDAAPTAVDGDHLYFMVPKATQSHANIHRDDRVCCVFESHPPDTGYYTIKGAIVHGRAQPIDDASGPAVHETLSALPDPANGTPVKDGAVFSVPLDDVASFDFAKIQRRFEQG